MRGQLVGHLVFRAFSATFFDEKEEHKMQKKCTRYRYSRMNDKKQSYSWILRLKHLQVHNSLSIRKTNSILSFIEL